MPVPKYTYHHVHVNSPDPVKTAEFYEKMFGAKKEDVIKHPDGGAMVHLNLHGSLIWVSSSKSQPPFYGLHHFGFITDNIEAAVAELKANGVKLLRDISSPSPGVKAAVLCAPDNVLIELWEEKAKK